jgi:hypothetical protein
MLQAGDTPIKESITVRPDDLLEIIVNAEGDDNVQKRALHLLEQYEFDGTKTFGDNLYFTLDPFDEDEVEC